MKNMANRDITLQATILTQLFKELWCPAQEGIGLPINDIPGVAAHSGAELVPAPIAHRFSQYSVYD